MTITLSEEAAERAEKQTTEWGFASVSDYFVALLDETEIEPAQHDQSIRDILRRSEDDFQAGRYRSFRDAVEDLIAHKDANPTK